MAFKRIRIVTDSTCDVPPELLEKWNITVIPCFVNFDGRSYADDGVELDRDMFFERISTMRTFPTTSAPPPALAERLIKPVFDDADHIIVVCVPLKLSSVYNSLRLGMANLPADRVTLVDSGQVTMGLGWQVLMAAQVAEETGDVQQVLDAIQRVRENEKMYAAVATMEYLRRSGRVNTLVASVGALLQIKPIIYVEDGEVLPYARVRTFKSTVDRLIHMVRDQAPLDQLAVLHVCNPAGADDVRARLDDVAPPDTFVSSIGPTIGAHLGPGSVGAALITKKWRI